MPCDSVAVVRARLEADVAAEILSAPEARDALVLWLRREFGACVVRSAAADELRLAVGVGTPAFEVWLRRRDGLATAGPDRAALASAAPRVEAVARDLARASVQERLVRSLKRHYAVESDEADPAGYRRLTVSLPT